MSEMQSCLAGGTHKTADILADVEEWLRRRADHVSSCEICNHSPADHFALHYSDDGWDPPFHFWLCREHQRALIEPVQEAIKKMKEERNAQVSA